MLLEGEWGVHILVISDKSIFGQGLCALLAEHDEFEVAGRVADTIEGEMLAQIELLRPDILIIECLNDEADSLPALMRCLKEAWVQKIITVNRRDNTMCVFKSQRRLVQQVEDLVEAITGDQ
jgi:DNA-binding NarL/FixJ family response regulator